MSDIGSWFAKRAFSNQSGQGGPAVQKKLKKYLQVRTQREHCSWRPQGHAALEVAAMRIEF